MKVLERRDIPPQQWDGVVQGSPEGFLFALSGWQEIIPPVKRWDLRDQGFGILHRGALAAVVPLHQRPDGALASSGWGWSGPVMRGDLSTAERREVMAAAMAELPRRARRLEARDLALGMPAMTDSSIHSPQGVNPFFPFGWKDTSRYTRVIDFTGQDEESLWQGLAPDARRIIRHCREAGFQVAQVPWPEHVDSYYAIHEETYTRTGVPPHPRAYFEGIARLSTQGPYSRLYAGYDPEGQVVAYHNVAVLNGLSLYHTGCSRTLHLNSGINYLLLWEAIRQAHLAGDRRYEVGIVDPSETDGKIAGLTRFKSKFGGILCRSFFASLRL